MNMNSLQRGMNINDFFKEKKDFLFQSPTQPFSQLE